MFLAVPIMVALMIICAQSETLRPLAVMLSREGPPTIRPRSEAEGALPRLWSARVAVLGAIIVGEQQPLLGGERLAGMAGGSGGAAGAWATGLAGFGRALRLGAARAHARRARESDPPRVFRRARARRKPRSGRVSPLKHTSRARPARARPNAKQRFSARALASPTS